MWQVELQVWSERGMMASGKVKQIKCYPVEQPDLTTKFHRFNHKILRIVLSYKCQDGSVDHCWISFSKYGFKFHYPDRTVIIDTLLLTTKQVPNMEDSMPLVSFAPWLAKKVGENVASEVMQLFLTA